jgi:hypothetical protein
MNFLSRLFALERREREVTAKHLMLLQAEQNLLESAAKLSEEWERLSNCAKRIDELKQKICTCGAHLPRCPLGESLWQQ